MIRTILAGALALGTIGLAGCAGETAAIQAENTDTVALNTFATIGRTLDNYETVKCGSAQCDPVAENDRKAAAKLLATAHASYTSGDSAAALQAVADLKAMVTTVKGL